MNNKNTESQIFELKDYFIGIDLTNDKDFTIQSNIKVKNDGKCKVVEIKKF